MGLLTSIPLASSSKGETSQSLKEAEENLITGYGQIVRDEEGNIVDVILPEGDEAAEEAAAESEDEVEANSVPAKTEVVKCGSLSVALLSLIPCSS